MKILLIGVLLAVVVNGIITEQPSNMQEPATIYCAKANSTTFYEVLLNDPNVLQKFDFNKTTHVFFHGWKMNTSEAWATSYKTNWINSKRGEKANLCFVDWSPLSYHEYQIASLNDVPNVGNYMAQVYFNWLRTQGLIYSDLILLGFSLGAQIAGYIGNSLKDQITFIIGMDPAGPLFQPTLDNYHLSDNDATYVQIIHTSTVYGYIGKTGDADFYINFGILFQPQCSLPDQLTIRCSHFRALYLFIDSLLYPTQNLCKGVKCSNVALYLAKFCSAETSLFGLDANKALTGEFYVSTKKSTTCTGDLYIDYIPTVV